MNRPAIYSPQSAPDCATQITSRFGVITYVLAIGGSLVAIGMLPSGPTAALIAAAVLCGWSEIDGVCGTSHVCTLTPMYRFNRRLWYRGTAGYTAGGLVTGSIVGGLLGVAGSLLDLANIYGLSSIAALALVLVTREFGWLSFRLPQVPRQTDKMWAMRFGVPVGATMWGAHIGLAFATVITHGGVFVIALLAMVLGPLKGSALMALYWLGRTLPIWLAPASFPGSHLPADLDQAISGNPACLRLAAAAGLVCAALTAIAFAQ